MYIIKYNSILWKKLVNLVCILLCRFYTILLVNSFATVEVKIFLLSTSIEDTKRPTSFIAANVSCKIVK